MSALNKKLPPLSKLKVGPVHLCPEETVHQALEFIYINNPEMFWKFEQRERTGKDEGLQIAQELETYLSSTVSKHVTLPDLNAVWVVMFELRRVVRAMFGLPFI